MRLTFMGTPAFALPALKSLHEAGHDIAAVYTQPPRPAGRGQKETPSPVHQYALEHGLPVHTPASLKTPEAQAAFAAHKADAAIVVAYGLLLPKPILEAYPLGCINVHPSLLPRWRGAAPLQRTIMAGDRETAIVIMQMDEGLDTGNMLLVERYPIAPSTTTGMLHDDLAAKAGPLLLKTLDGLKSNTITPIPQGNAGVTYAKKITKEECAIDWNRPAQVIYHQILGLSPHPGAHFTHGGETIKIFAAEYDDAPAKAPPGTVLDGHLSIACQPGILRLLQIQRPGKKRLPVEEALHGFSIPPGTNLAGTKLE
jgi:methionyl-tRNA formyltransferase